MTIATVYGRRYELGDVIGSGGMSVVFLAHDRETDRTVALKLLADNLSADPGLRERFRREAALAQRLSHPNVVRVLGSGETDGRAFIALEYMEGGNLAEEIDRDGPLPARRVAALGAQAAAGLAHAHEHGLVHRDVKPQNLLLAADGTLEVSDFGIAHAVDGTRLTEVGTVLGTAAYLAPEQARGEQATPASDVYALGVVLRELSGGAPAELEGLVAACLQEDPAARPTAHEVERVLRGELVAPTRVMPAAPTAVLHRLDRPRKIAVGAVAVSAAIGLGVGIGIAAGGGRTQKPRPVQAAIPPLPSAATPAASAQAYAHWLRARAR